MMRVNVFGLNIILEHNKALKIIQMMKAAEIVGQDRESSQRDLYDAIENGDYPKWKMYIQVMTEEQAKIIQIIHLI